MPIVKTGVVEDLKNLSDEDFYAKHLMTKDGVSFGYTIDERLPERKPVENKEPSGFWNVVWSEATANPLVTYGKLFWATIGGEKDEDFHLTTENTSGFEDHLGALSMAKNEQQLNEIKSILQEEELKKQVIADSNGFSGLVARLTGASLDPTFYASGGVLGIGLKAVKGLSWFNKAKNFGSKLVGDVFGKDFAKTAGASMLYGASAGAASGAAVGGIYSGFQTLTQNVDSTDALKSMASFAILGGGFGAFVGAGRARNLSLQNKKAEKLINAMAIKNPNKIVLTDEEFQKAINDPKFIDAKIKGAIGMEHLGVSPDVRGNLSPSNVVKTIFNTLVDTPFSIINKETKELIVVSPSVESTASPLINTALCHLQKYMNEGYTNWLKEQPGNEGLAHLKAWKNAKIWAGGKDYERFLAEVNKEVFNPGSTSSEAVKALADKLEKDIIIPASNYGQKYDLWNHKASDLFDIDQEIKALGKVEVSPKDLIDGKIPEEIKVKQEKLKELQSKRKEIENKTYTHEDFKSLVEGERYFPRRFDPIKVSKDRDGAIEAIKEGLWSVSEYSDLKSIPEAKMTAEQRKAFLKEDAKLKEIAKESVSNILHEGDKGYVLNPRKVRGAEHARKFNFSTKYINQYLIDDPANALRDFVRTVYTDVELIKRFGTLDRNILAEAIEKDYKDLIEKATSDKQRKALVDRKERDLEDLKCIWCRVRGVNEYTSFDLSRWGRAFNHAANIMNNLNVARLIGGTVLAATSDLAQAYMTLGFKNFFKGYSNLFRKDFWKAYMGEEDTWIRAVDHFKNTRALGFYNQMIDRGILAAADNFSGKLADLGVKMSMINRWDEMNKFIVGYVTQEKILKIGERVSKGGKLSTREFGWLSSTGITEENAAKMFEQFKKYGRVSEGGTWESSVGFWDNEKLQDMFRGGVRKIQNVAILTPTAGSVPLAFDVAFFKPILQFKRFTFSAYSKCMLPALQKKDLEAFTGVTMMMTIGVMKAYLRAMKSGVAINMTDAIKSSLKEAEVVSFMGDAYGLGSLLLGLNEKASMPNQQFLREAFGTGYDFMTTYFSGAQGLIKLMTGSELSYGQVHNIRKMLPLQNNILLFPLFNKIEDQAIWKFGTPKAKQKQLIKQFN